MYEKCKRISKNVILAIVVIFTYDIINALFLIGAVFLSTEDAVQNHYFQIDTFSCALLTVLFSIWLYRIQHRERYTTIELRPFSDYYMMCVIPVIVLGMGGISILWLNLADSVLQNVSVISDSMDSFNQTWSAVEEESYFWVLMSVVVLGPIVEELMFRGAIFHYLEKIKAGWFPVVVSGIAFGVWHQELVQVVYAAIIGILLGYIYAKTRDIRVTITIHILNNFLSALPPALDTPAVQAVVYKLSIFMIVPTLMILVQWGCASRGSDSSENVV